MFHSGCHGTVINKQDGQYDCKRVHDPVITVSQIIILRRIVWCSTHPVGSPGLRMPAKTNMPIGQQITNKTPSNSSQWQKYYLLLWAHSQHLHNKHSHAVKFILKLETPVSCARCPSDLECYYVFTWMIALQDFTAFHHHENFRSYTLHKNICQLHIFTLLGSCTAFTNLDPWRWDQHNFPIKSVTK